ncbi:MAG TPA: retention module-containing protein, partial [Azospira sp.]|nr:retention module-containing protein [Azospira sp.]
MANNNVVAKVVLIVGQAHAKAPNGTMRKLAIGDVIREGEQIVTSQGGRVELGFEDGSVRIARVNEPVHPDSFDTLPADSDKKPAELAGDETSRVIDALAQGRNIDDLLQDPAAGLRSGGGRSDGGHAFVRLDRIVEPVSPISFDFGTGDRTNELPIGGLGDDSLSSNALPVAVADTNTVSELVDSTLPSTTSGNVLANLKHGTGYADQADSDPEGDVLTVTQARFGTAAPVAAGTPMTLAYGTLVLNADGTYTYSVDNANPTVNALNIGGVLTEVVTYSVSDGKGGSATTTLTITIGGVNDTPTATVGSPITAPEDTESIVVPLRGTDPDSPLQSITVTTLPPSSQGTLFKPDGTPVVPGEPIPVGPDGSVQLVFVPAPNFNGTVDIPFAVTDNQGATSPGAIQQIVITPVNDGPLAVNDSASTQNGQPVTINVLGNDSDPDDDPLTIVGTPTASNGTVTVNTDGSLTYRPNPGFSGTETFTYTVVDPSGATSTATVTVNVAPPVNLPPIASPDAESTPAGVAISRNVLSNDTDPEGRSLNVTGFRVDTNGDGTPETFTPGQTATIAGVGTLTIAVNGVYTFTPAAGFTGTVPAISYTVTDGALSAGSTLTLTVLGGPNSPPVATDDVNSVPINGSASGNVLTDGTPDSDVEGDPLTVTGFAIDTNGDGTAENFTAGQTASIAGVGTLTIGTNGAYTFTPLANYAGPVPVATYSISDGNGGTDSATLTLTMGSNTPPVATDNSAPVTEDTPVSGNVLTDGTADSDPDGNPLTVTGFAIDTNGDGTPEAFTAGQTATIPGVGTLTIGTNGAYTFTPAPDYTGAIPVASYTISDGLGGTDTATLTLGPVGAVNDPPVATDDVNSVPINGSAS